MAKEVLTEKNLGDVKAESKRGKLDLKVLAIVAVLGLLIMVSAVQAVELTSLKEKINTEFSDLAVLSIGGGGITTASTTATDLKKNLANLPSMVGGC